MPLVVITGCDGAGKSTMIEFLSARNNIYRRAHWLDFARALGLERTTAAGAVGTLHPMTRAHFILTINLGLWEHVIKPMQENGEIVVCESYYFKFLAKERVFRSAAPALIEELTRLPPPDLIVDVGIEPEVAFTRLAHAISPYETISGSVVFDDFVTLQRLIRRELEVLTASLQVPILSIDGSRGIDENVTVIDKWIQVELAQLSLATQSDVRTASKESEGLRRESP